MNQSNKESTISSWFFWQFYEAPVFLLSVWKNYLIFASNMFSVGLLLKTFFAPWRRYKWGYPKALDIGEFFSTLISNTFSRIIGAIMRVVLIFVGFIFKIFIIIIGAAALLFWVLTPFIILVMILFVFIY